LYLCRRFLTESRLRGDHLHGRGNLFSRDHDDEDPHGLVSDRRDTEPIKQVEEIGVGVGRSEGNGVHVFGGARGRGRAVRQAHSVAAVVQLIIPFCGPKRKDSLS
jgi:hypothetical protein